MRSFIQNDKVLNLIKPYCKEAKVYIVGGFVRDAIMGKASLDRDLIVDGVDVKEFSKNLADKLNAYFVELDDVNKIYRIVLENKIDYIDLTCPIENDFEKDIKRRDLTINAIAYDLTNDELVDLVGGVEDIKNKKIKGISFQNFEDDPLRLLRIFRFYAKTGFDIDEELISTAKQLHKRINEPSKERVTVELLKMFEGKYTDLALEKLDECGLLEEILPIYKEVKKVPKNTHHHLDLLHHLIETVRQIQIIYENSNEEIKSYLDEETFGAVKRVAFLKFAGFLHDIGKPACWTIDEETGRHRFIQHDSVGADLAVPILRELKCSKKQIEYIKTLIKYHIYPSSLVTAEDVTEKAFMKFYRKMEKVVIDVIIIAMADRLSARGEAITEEIVNQNINALTKLLNNYLELRKNMKPLEKLIDGKEIMELLNITQGPLLGNIIKSLNEEQISGNIVTKQDAIDFILKNFSIKS